MDLMVSSTAEFLKSQVPDWEEDNNEVWTARFKAFSGQRSDWEDKFQFWRCLIISLARHLSCIIIDSDEVRNKWFARQGLVPLCLNDVLLEMYRNGDLAKPSYFDDMSSSRFHWVFNLASWIGITTPDASEQCERKYVVLQLLQGIKIALEPKTTITSVSEFDCDMLHLQWIRDKLQSQLDVLEKRYEAVSDLAVKEAKAGHKQAALRHLRNKKVAFARKEKCQGFIDKVEEILRGIAVAESTKKVVEAIKVGAQCLKEHSLDIEEIHAGIDGLDEAIASQKHVEEFLESMPVAATEIEDRELEDELAELELELEPIDGLVEKSIPGLKPQHSAASNKTETLEMADSVCQKLSKLELEPS